MDTVQTGTAAAPKALIRSALVMMDLGAVPLLGSTFLAILTLSLGTVAIAAAGANFILGLRSFDFFPEFPVAARILAGMSLLAFAAFLLVLMLLLWHLFRALWRRYWGWHGSAWRGIFLERTALPTGTGHDEQLPARIRLLKRSGLVFLSVLAAALAVMFLLARGPFWHVWRWFV